MELLALALVLQEWRNFTGNDTKADTFTFINVYVSIAFAVFEYLSVIFWDLYGGCEGTPITLGCIFLWFTPSLFVASYSLLETLEGEDESIGVFWLWFFLIIQMGYTTVVFFVVLNQTFNCGPCAVGTDLGLTL